jgi:hypothetical protein
VSGKRERKKKKDERCAVPPTLSLEQVVAVLLGS